MGNHRADSVFRGKFGGKSVAVKRVRLRSDDAGVDDEDSKRNEETALRLLDHHPNVIKLLEVESNSEHSLYK